MLFRLLKKIFSNEVGQEVKPKWKVALFVIIGLILAIVIPTLFVYLEAWEITINLQRLIWETENRFRFPYFISFILSNLAFIIVAMLSIFRLHSHEASEYERYQNDLLELKSKKAFRIMMLILYVITITLYVIALFN